MQDLIRQFKDKQFPIVLPSNLWGTVDSTILKIIQSSKWVTFKYLDANHKLSLEISKISANKGGIYIFYISPEIIKGKQRILAYIGRARYTESQNLRKRIREYYGYLPPDYSRPKVNTMMKEWSDYLYCSYMELDDNETIDSIERELISKLIPPFNDAIPNHEIAYAASAAFL